MKKIIWITALVILLVAAGWFTLHRSASMDNPPPASDMTAEEGNADRDLMDTTANDEVSIPEGATEIRYMDDGFSPAVVEVSVGSIVTFVNDSSRDFWPASDLHPTHKSYPGSSIGKCGTEEADSIFDACGGIAPGGSYSFTFDEVGEWNYHDHLRASLGGTVVVK